MVLGSRISERDRENQAVPELARGCIVLDELIDRLPGGIAGRAAVDRCIPGGLVRQMCLLVLITERLAKIDDAETFDEAVTFLSPREIFAALHSPDILGALLDLRRSTNERRKD